MPIDRVISREELEGMPSRSQMKKLPEGWDSEF